MSFTSPSSGGPFLSAGVDPTFGSVTYSGTGPHLKHTGGSTSTIVVDAILGIGIQTDSVIATSSTLRVQRATVASATFRDPTNDIECEFGVANSLAGGFIQTATNHDFLMRTNATTRETWKADGEKQFQMHAAFAGSAQKTLTGAVQTTAGAATNVLVYTLADDTVYQYNVLVTARRTDVAGRSVFWRRGGVFRASAGSATEIAAEQTPAADQTSGTITASFAVTVTGNNVQFAVTGAASQTINWVCVVCMLPVSGNA